MAESRSKLGKYRAKRSADRTPEPFGGDSRSRRPRWPPPGRGRACSASRSTPRAGCTTTSASSWAACCSPGRSRRALARPRREAPAVEVEDHPVEYADFEGVIPEGNYGAGAVIVWDQGVWIPLEDPDEGMKKGKLLFELRGYKLRGLWHLVRTKRATSGPEGVAADQEAATPGPAPEGASALTPESIFSGLTLEELRDGHEAGGADPRRARAAGRAAASRSPSPRSS